MSDKKFDQIQHHIQPLSAPAIFICDTFHRVLLNT